VLAAISAVADASTVDEVLTEVVRARYVTLLDAESVTEALGPATRYDLAIDTERFADEFPLRWRAFTTGAVPGSGTTSPLPLSVRLTDDRMLVAVDAARAGWSWRRASWSVDPFVPEALLPDPSSSTIRAACTTDGGEVYWETPIASCDEALATARGVAEQTGATAALADAGVPGADIGPRIDQTVARLCEAMANPQELVDVEEWEATFGAALVTAGICVGDPTVLVP
jgi:hypothetical protein